MSAISNSYLPLQQYHAAAPQEEAKWNVITGIVKRSFEELAVIALFTCATLLFVPTIQGVITLATLAISVFAINTLLRMISGFFQYRAVCAFQDGKNDASSFLNFLSAFSFSKLDSTTRNVLTHELGHAGASYLFYDDPQPRINIYPLEGGATNFYIDQLTPLGRLIGPKASEILTTMAGPLAAVGCATVALAYARTLGDDQGVLKMYLIISAITSIAEHILYAISAFWTPSKHVSHDFRALWNHGIHPIFCIFTMAIAPLLTYFWPSSSKTEPKEILV